MDRIFLSHTTITKVVSRRAIRILRSNLSLSCPAARLQRHLILILVQRKYPVRQPGNERKLTGDGRAEDSCGLQCQRRLKQRETYAHYSNSKAHGPIRSQQGKSPLQRIVGKLGDGGCRRAVVDYACNPKGMARVPTHSIRPPAERRAYSRAKLSLSLRVKRIAGQRENEAETLRTTNISSSGVLFLCPQLIEPGHASGIGNLSGRPAARAWLRENVDGSARCPRRFRDASGLAHGRSNF